MGHGHAVTGFVGNADMRSFSRLAAGIQPLGAVLNAVDVRSYASTYGDYSYSTQTS